MSDGLRMFEPRRSVEVLHDDGRWWPGEQVAWVRQADGSWKASVTYSAGIGQTYVRSVPETWVRLPTGGGSRLTSAASASDG